MEIIFPGAVAVQAVAVAARLGLADLAASGPRTVDELARATNTKADSLARLLRALVSLGIFVQDESGRFQNNTLSDFLRSDDVTGRRAWALLLAAPYLWRSLGELEEVVHSGEPAFDRIHGDSMNTWPAMGMMRPFSIQSWTQLRKALHRPWLQPMTSHAFPGLWT